MGRNKKDVKACECALQELQKKNPELNSYDCAFILLHQGFSQRHVASNVSLKRTQLQRAISTVKKGNDIGQIGRPRELKEAEEIQLVQKCKEMKEKRDSISFTDLIEEASTLRAQRKGVQTLDCPPTKGWVHRFIERHRSEIHERSCRLIEQERIDACNTSNITSYLSRLSTLMVTNRYLPEMIFNHAIRNMGLNQILKSVCTSRSC